MAGSSSGQEVALDPLVRPWYWMAFVPRSAGDRSIDVIAYGTGGDRLGTPFTLRNP